MLIDLHFHTSKFSSCSRMTLEEGLGRARDLGLGGICVTEHDVFPSYRNLDELSSRFGLAVFIGVEIFTVEGDILCFGLDRLPRAGLSARELTEAVAEAGGAAIAAHPYRDNNRGVGDLLFDLPKLTAVEAFNGNTAPEDNARALRAARELGLPVTGSSDAHSIDRVGVFATEFESRVGTLAELIAALRGGNYRPASFDRATGSYA